MNALGSYTLPESLLSPTTLAPLSPSSDPFHTWDVDRLSATAEVPTSTSASNPQVTIVSQTVTTVSTSIVFSPPAVAAQSVQKDTSASHLSQLDLQAYFKSMKQEAKMNNLQMTINRGTISDLATRTNIQLERLESMSKYIPHLQPLVAEHRLNAAAYQKHAAELDKLVAVAQVSGQMLVKMADEGLASMQG